MSIKEDFMAKTKMKDVHGQTVGVEEVMDYLVTAETVNKMIIASEMELPVLTLIAKELEEKFDINSNFPVVVTDRISHKNSTARQNVGRMIKFVMEQYGYTPVAGGLSERARIPAISGSKHFSTSGIYKKTKQANYEISTVSVKVQQI